MSSLFHRKIRNCFVYHILRGEAGSLDRTSPNNLACHSPTTMPIRSVINLILSAVHWLQSQSESFRYLIIHFIQNPFTQNWVCGKLIVFWANYVKCEWPYILRSYFGTLITGKWPRLWAKSKVWKLDPNQANNALRWIGVKWTRHSQRSDPAQKDKYNHGIVSVHRWRDIADLRFWFGSWWWRIMVYGDHIGSSSKSSYE